MANENAAERRRAGLGLLIGFPLAWQFFGAIALLVLGGGWSTFLWFGGGVTVFIYAVAFLVVGVACFLDWKEARA